MKRSNLANEIIADVNDMKRQAGANALEILKETYEDEVHELIARGLAEEEGVMDDEDEYFEDPLDAPAPEEIPSEEPPASPAAEPSPEPTTDLAPEADPFAGEEEEFDFGDVDIDEILSELEGEDLDEPLDEYSDASAEDNAEEYVDDGKDGTPAGSELSEEALGSLIDEVLEEMAGEEEELDESEEEKPSSSTDLETENTELEEENKELKETLLSMKKDMQAINLMNSKLMHSVKISNKFPSMTVNEKVDLLSTLDKATTVHEVKLIAETFVGKQKRNENKKKTTTRRRRKKNPLKESASRRTPSAKSTPEYFSRFQELARIGNKS